MFRESLRLLAARKGRGLELLSLGLIMGLAFYIGMIPRLDYAYPLHADEWTHLAEADRIVASGSIPDRDPITGEARSSPPFETGYHLFLAEFQLLTGLDWPDIFRYLPSSIIALTALAAYMYGRRRGFGLEAALFASLVPTTIRFLGPAFAVPVALGLFFVPFTLFLVDRFWTSRGLPLLLLALLAFLFVAHSPTAALASLIIGLYWLFRTVGPSLARPRLRGQALAQLALVLSAVGVASLALLLSNSRVFDTLTEGDATPRQFLAAPGWLISRTGYIPFGLFGVGLLMLVRSRKGAERALLLATAIVGVYVLFYYWVESAGPEVIYSRALLYLSILMLLVAALAVGRFRRRLVQFLRPRWPGEARSLAAGVVTLALVLPTVALTVNNRYNEDVYRLIDDAQYEDFLWIRQNLCPQYDRALIDISIARPFAAVSGRYAYAAVPLLVSSEIPPLVHEGSLALQEGVPDANWLRERGLNIVYSEGPVSNSELVKVRDRVYVLPPSEVCANEG